MKKSISIFLSVLICLSCVCVGAHAAEPEAEVSIHVSPGGDDGNSGTIDSPLATVEGAKKKAKAMGGNLTVFFHEGTYTFSDTLTFDSSDGANVTYSAYENDRVVFTAGVALSGFEECKVNGVKAFSKDVGKGADFNVLFNDKTALQRTRYPEKGYLYVKKVKESYIEDYDKQTVEDVFLPCVAMDVNPGDVPDIKNPGDAVVRILHYWKDEMLGIKSYDAKTGLMRFNKRSSMTIAANDRFFIENVFEALNEPGEWYLDKSAGILYYIPEEGEKADSLTLWGSATETLINVNNVDGIKFNKIIFRGNGFSVNPEPEFPQAAYDATPCLSFENGTGFSVQNCEFRDIGACAVFIGKNVTNTIADSNIFDNLGAHAVYIRGENVDVSSENATRDIRVTNNLISRYGRVYFNAVGVLVIHANSVEISNNEIHDGYYTAISVGWVWGYANNITYNCKITDNLIYNIGQGWLSDMGGIYTLGIQPGTIISGNVIHNVAADPEEGGYGGWGIYLDEGSSLITVEKNLVYACGSDAYHLHYGSSNIVRNNIFALSGESQVRICSAPQRVERAKEISGTAQFPTATFTNNIYLTDNHIRAYSHWDEKSIRESDNIFWDITNREDVLLGIYSDVKHATSIRSATRKGYITNPYVIDPQFKDPAAFDFTFADSKAVEETGFEPWDYSAAGTIAGTVTGVSTPAGTTLYNAESACVPMTKAKEPFHWLIRWFEQIKAFFEKLFHI